MFIFRISFTSLTELTAHTEKEIIITGIRIHNTLEFNLGQRIPLHLLHHVIRVGGVEAVIHTVVVNPATFR